jgi:hypothetical protein
MHNCRSLPARQPPALRLGAQLLIFLFAFAAHAADPGRGRTHLSPRIRHPHYLLGNAVRLLLKYITRSIYDELGLNPAGHRRGMKRRGWWQPVFMACRKEANLSEIPGGARRSFMPSWVELHEVFFRTALRRSAHLRLSRG